MSDTTFTFTDGSMSYTNSSTVTSNDYGVNRNNLIAVSFGTSCIKIANLAFMDCPNLTSVSFNGNSVTNIGNSAFRGCTGLTSFTIPSSVNFIGIDALRDCRGLTEILVDASNNSFSNNSGDSVNVLYNKDITTLINYPSGNIASSYTIPSNVTTIFDAAFNNSSNLTSITFQTTTDPSGNQISNVTSIGSFAFRNSGLTSITIPDSAVNLGTGIFESCVNLVTATMSNTNKIVPNDIFNGCTSLTTVSLSNNTTAIGSSAFEGCSVLTSITIPDNVTHIAANCFKGCSTLSSVIMNTTSPLLRIIGNSAFESCPLLTSITIPDSVISIGGNAFVGTGISSSSSSPFTLPDSLTTIGQEAFMGTQLTSLEIPNSVNLTGNGLLKDCVKLESVSIGARITRITDEMLSGCSDLTSITVSENVNYIGAKAFNSCTSLSSITLGEGIKSIRNLAFANCIALSPSSSPTTIPEIPVISFLGSTAPMNVGIGLFTGVTKNSYLKVFFYNTNITTDASGIDIPDIQPKLLKQIQNVVNDTTVYPISDHTSGTTKQLFYSTSGRP